MRIAVTSGKGGTGKTTVAVSLAVYLANQGIAVDLYDCDVEEPNTNLFLQAAIDETEQIHVMVPDVEMELCVGCGKCEEICAFSAIVLFKNKPVVFPDMCHSCGGCMLVCPEGAITEKEKPVGVIENGAKGTINFRGGILKISEPVSPPLINKVKKYVIGSNVNIFDSPPGASCPVIATLRDCNYAIVTTEPTPFGLHDLQLMVGLLREMKIPFGVLINKANVGDSGVKHYCSQENITVIAEIPHSLELASAYAKGDFVPLFLRLFDKELDSIISYIGINDAAGGLL